MAATDHVPPRATPGKVLASASRYLPGPGTHLYEGQIISSLLGTVTIASSSSSSSSSPSSNAIPGPGPGPASGPSGPAKRLTRITASSAATTTDGKSSSQPSKPTISVSRYVDRKREALPDVSNVVLCRVARLTQRQAIVNIQQVGGTVLRTEWQGVIRAQDVRATEKDKVKIQESFRPGDIVRAQVISLGDQSNYYLSTARNELGVIMATSEAGNDMVPVSWKEYRDPETGITELRKVAKPN